MSVEFRSKSHRIASHGISESTLTGRRFAAMLTGGAAALALVLATAIPAKADKKDDLAKALIAALVVGAIAHELKDRDRPAPAPAPAPLPEPVSSRRVPSVCAISIDGADRSVSLYPESCLRAEGFRHRLPRGCSNGATIFGERDRVYSAKCLRDAGFRVQGN
ncbi:hypothetical protein [Tabrizicola flagellatus]|uniref:hypothetical protein n=1 Tax=Tabrizicola flagellatus TaxID=2593021 RepID=UPI0011F31E8C|nr:hypothetical protein [Tabrizicola flagellatus]